MAHLYPQFVMIHTIIAIFLHASLADVTLLTVDNSSVEVTGKDMEMMLVVGEAAIWT